MDAEQLLQQQLANGLRDVSNANLSVVEYIDETIPRGGVVSITNPFEHPTGWVFSEPSEAREHDGSRFVYPGKQRMRVLKKGERVRVGRAEALVAINRLLHDMIQEDDHLSGNDFNIDSVKKLFERAKVSEYDINTGEECPLVERQEVELTPNDIILADNTPQQVTPKPAADDLGFDDEPTPAPKRRGRPPKSA